MKIIGLTGGIGSGKTIICKIFNTLGIPVYNSDIEAKLLMNNDVKIISELKNKFGDDIYNENKLNKEKLAKLIFNDNNNLNFVNNTVHPAVKLHFNKWTEKQNSEFVIKETAILFESGTYKDVDFIITVIAPENIRINRIIARDNLKKEDIQAILANQISDNEKIDRSNFIINNDNKKLVLPQILNIYKNIGKNLNNIHPKISNIRN